MYIKIRINVTRRYLSLHWFPRSLLDKDVLEGIGESAKPSPWRADLATRQNASSTFPRPVPVNNYNT